MFTPQDIQEQTFQKAVFGGYDMQQVDDFLEPLTTDYITLYKENAVLKSKMKILVEKLEEYRAQEADMKKSVAETQAKCDQMLLDARAQADTIAQGAQFAVQDSALQSAIAQEQERLNYAKQTALNFIDVVEKDIRGHLDLLETLKSRDLSVEQPAEQPARHEKPYDWQADLPKSQPAPAESAEDIASEISENLEKLVGSEENAPAEQADEAPKPLHPDSATIKFGDLKFGRNYDPTR